MTKRFKMAVILASLAAMTSASTAYAASNATSNCSKYNLFNFLRKGCI